MGVWSWLDLRLWLFKGVFDIMGLDLGIESGDGGSESLLGQGGH